MDAAATLLMLYKALAILLFFVYIWFYNKFKWKISQDVWLIFLVLSPLGFVVTQFCYLYLTGIEFYKSANLTIFYLHYTWYFTQIIIFFLPAYMLYKYCPYGKFGIVLFVTLSSLMLIINLDFARNLHLENKAMILLAVAICNLIAFIRANLCLNIYKI